MENIKKTPPMSFFTSVKDVTWINSGFVALHWISISCHGAKCPNRMHAVTLFTYILRCCQSYTSHPTADMNTSILLCKHSSPLLLLLYLYRARNKVKSFRATKQPVVNSTSYDTHRQALSKYNSTHITRNAATSAVFNIGISRLLLIIVILARN